VRSAGGTTFDEELTPSTDPPLLEPPPTATLLGRIFAHRRTKRTVVSAPLLRMAEPAEPAEPPVEAVAAPAEVAAAPVPVAEDAPVPPWLVDEPEGVAAAAVAPPPVEVPVVEVPVVEEWPGAPDGSGTDAEPASPTDVMPVGLTVGIPGGTPAAVAESPAEVPDVSPDDVDGGDAAAAEAAGGDAADDGAVGEGAVVADADTTRFCAMCGGRVRADRDGLRCYLGHRLSPAHADAPRDGWLHRLLRRG
jgi:hypothetical protein